ncbi:hypothetical protein [Actinospongicola halichondriae]|uniref:hypothetical protein n=1 Tax=Actinospongicola halichondriae TaxID=3236844 RepID=UPI003D4900C0
MSATEAERHELYELARHHVNDRYAELMMKSLPPEPERLATKDDVAFAQAATRADMAELRTELKGDMAEMRVELKGDMAEMRVELKGDMAEMRAELVDRIEAATTRSTRTIVLSLVGSVTAMSIANTLTIALTR